MTCNQTRLPNNYLLENTPAFFHCFYTSTCIQQAHECDRLRVQSFRSLRQSLCLLPLPTSHVQILWHLKDPSHILVYKANNHTDVWLTTGLYDLHMNVFSFDIARHIKFRVRDASVWDRDLQVLQNCKRGGAWMIPTVSVVELQAKFWHHNIYYGKHKRCADVRHIHLQILWKKWGIYMTNLVSICIYPKQIYTRFGCMSLALIVHKSWQCWILSISAHWSVITCPDTSAFKAKFESNLCTSHLQVYNRTLVNDIKVNHMDLSANCWKSLIGENAQTLQVALKTRLEPLDWMLMNGDEGEFTGSITNAELISVLP
jgi:hypothetical protein